MIIEKKNTADLLPADYNPRKDLKPVNAEQLCDASQYCFFIIAINAAASSSDSTGRIVAINLDFFSTVSPSPPLYKTLYLSLIFYLLLPVSFHI